MAATPTVSALLRDRIAERMLELGISPTDLEQATGLTGPGLAPVRRGEVRRYQTRLKRPLTEALGWTLDSIDRLLDGQEPRLTGAATPTIEDLDRKLSEVLELVRKLAGRPAPRRREVVVDGTPSSMPRPVLRGKQPHR